MIERSNAISNPEDSRYWPKKLALGAAAMTGAIIGGGIVHMLNRHEKRQLREEARTDVLTGIPNRRGFEEAFADAYYRMNARGDYHRRRSDIEALALLIADVDKLKMINDTHGHDAGDDVIKYVAHALQNSVRGNGDVVGRWAGDEYGILLPVQDEDEAEMAAEKVQARIDGLLNNGLTVTVGAFITYRNQPLSPQQIFDKADDEMYRRKKERTRKS